jgi:hypothetical protein
LHLPDTSSFEGEIRTDYLHFRENHVCIRAYLVCLREQYGSFSAKHHRYIAPSTSEGNNNPEQKLVHHILMNMK